MTIKVVECISVTLDDNIIIYTLFVTQLQGLRMSADRMADSEQKLHSTVSAAVESQASRPGDPFVVECIGLLS